MSINHYIKEVKLTEAQCYVTEGYKILDLKLMDGVLCVSTLNNSYIEDNIQLDFLEVQADSDFVLHENSKYAGSYTHMDGQTTYVFYREI